MKTALFAVVSVLVLAISFIAIAEEKVWEAGWVTGTSGSCYDRSWSEDLARTDAKNKAYDVCNTKENCWLEDVTHGTMGCEECSGDSDPPQFRCEVESKVYCKCRHEDQPEQ